MELLCGAHSDFELKAMDVASLSRTAVHKYNTSLSGFNAHQRQEKYDPNQYAREKAAKLERAKQIKADRMAAARQRENQKVMATVFKC